MLRGNRVFPICSRKSIQNASASRELKPVVGYFLSTLIALAPYRGLALAEQKGSNSSILRFSFFSTVALATIFTGTFIIVGRRLAVMQIVGYILLENGNLLPGSSPL